MATPHIESEKGDIAKVVLMPGDPLRAKYIADNYLTDVRVVNNVRNMTAYTGKYKGKEITVFLMEWVFQVVAFISMNYINFMMLRK